MKLKLFGRTFTWESHATVIIEEKTYKDGHLYIKRETKTGKAAEKEIEKHSDSMSKAIEKFLTDFWN